MGPRGQNNELLQSGAVAFVAAVRQEKPGRRSRRLGRVAAALLAAALLAAAARPALAQVMVEAWGYNGDGELGNGSTVDSSVPVPVGGLSGGVTAIGGGAGHSLALQNGSVYAWGWNQYGQLGDNSTMNSSVPVPVSGLSSGVTAIAGGFGFSLAVQNGGVYAWGNNAGDPLGNNSGMNSSVPLAVSGLSSGVTAIAAGYAHGLAVRSGGAYAWGYGEDGELGDNSSGPYANSPVPVAVSGLSSGVTAIAGGFRHSLAVRNGGAYAWGFNIYGELGDNSTMESAVPVAVSGLSSGVTAIAAGWDYSLAVQNGGVYAWGYNYYGQLGDGTTNNQFTPEQIDPTDLHDIIAIAANNDGTSSYALSSDGSIWDWGYNYYGDLGLGNANSPYLTPQHLLPPSGYAFTAIEANGAGALAIVTPIPEPAGLWLLVPSFAVLLRQRRARRARFQA